MPHPSWMMHEIVRDWEILSTGPGGLAMGLQETLRRRCAPNTTHVAPRSAPIAHPPAPSPSTPVTARGGECVLGWEARRGGHGGGGGEARAARLRELAPPPLSPLPPPAFSAG